MDMKGTVISIEIGSFRTASKSWKERVEELEIKERIRTIRKTSFLWSSSKSEETWKSEENCCPSDASVRQPIKISVKTFQKRVNNDRNSNNNHNITVIPWVIGTLGTVPKGLEGQLEELEIGGRI